MKPIFIAFLLLCGMYGFITAWALTESSPDPTPVRLQSKANRIINGKVRQPDAYYMCCAFDNGAWPAEPMLRYDLYGNKLYIKNGNPDANKLFKDAKYIYVAGRKYKFVKLEQIKSIKWKTQLK